jgi:hypothetical protein
VRVDVRDPENEGGDSRQRGDATRVVGVGSRSRDDDREHDDRPVDEAFEALADRITSEADSSRRTRPVVGHARIMAQITHRTYTGTLREPPLKPLQLESEDQLRESAPRLR